MSTGTPSIPGIFVVGTDTGVGKTRVAAALARTWMLAGHRVGVLKPVSTGATRGADGFVWSDDVTRLAESISTEGSPFPPPPLDRVGPLVFEAPLAPPVAARRAGTPLEPHTLVRATDDALAWWLATAGAARMVVEGVGGLLCPVAEGGYTVADLAGHLDYPLLIVARRGLGTLNHTLLTVEAAQSRGLRIAGIILNAARSTGTEDLDPAEASNAEELARLLPGVAILADWPHGADHPPVPIAPEAGHWLDLAQPPRRSVGVGVGDSAGRADTAPAIRVPLGSGPGSVPFEAALAPPPPDSVLASDDELAAPPDVDLIGSSGSGSSEPITALAPPVALAADAPRSAEFPALNLNLILDPTPRAAPVGAVIAPAPPSASNAPSSDDEYDDEAPPSSWRSALLTSYASAITLALGWTLYQHRNDSTTTTTPLEVAAPDPAHNSGRLGDRSRTITPLTAVPTDHVVQVGQTLTVGSLRVEPIEVGRRDVILERVSLTGKAESKTGGRRVVTLRIRLRNTSKDAVFAPVDPAFVRPDAQDQSETLLELNDGRKVYTYPLAVESEWMIAGQGFGDLRPGESREVVFATTSDAPAGVEREPGTWRLKLRTGASETAVVGVRLNGPATGKK